MSRSQPRSAPTGAKSGSTLFGIHSPSSLLLPYTEEFNTHLIHDQNMRRRPRETVRTTPCAQSDQTLTLEAALLLAAAAPPPAAA